jgi:pimeloyl-ACP methyl ester carboxylesterase
VRRVEAGAGEPAVVLEAGLNNAAASWQRVVPLLVPYVRTAAYDRAGLGASAPAPGLVTIDRKLAALLRALDVPAGETLDDQPQAEEGLVIET